MVRVLRWGWVALVLGLAAVGCLAPPALAADSVYWTAGSAIRVGSLDGSGSPQNLGTSYTSETAPFGVAIDSAAGKIYWTDATDAAIRVGSLDGSGSPHNLGTNYTSESNPYGVAIDPAAGKIYWADHASGAIRVGRLDGSGSPQNLGTNYGSESKPHGVAIDPAAGKIYWTDQNSPGGAIRVGNLDGSGSPQNLGTHFTSENYPTGVAIDPAAGRIYWTDVGSGAIRVGNLDGSGSPQNLGTNYTNEIAPYGVAIDSRAGKIYWANNGSAVIRVGNLDGSGSPQNLGANYNADPPRFLALLRAPVAVGAPRLTGGSSAGSQLSCSRGAWAPDLPGAQLYHAPQSFAFQWTRDGRLVPGASSSTLSANTAGKYVCSVFAVNHAGSSVQASVAHGVLSKAKITKAKINQARHAAKFRFKGSAGSTVFQCALVKVKKRHKKQKPHFAKCKSPKAYKHLKAGKYIFEVRTLSTAGPGTPALKSFKIH